MRFLFFCLFYCKCLAIRALVTIEDGYDCLLCDEDSFLLNARAQPDDSFKLCWLLGFFCLAENQFFFPNFYCLYRFGQ